MTNRKTTKRALLGSVLALILCFSMLLGSTYAWFSDTDYVAVNKIQSGILDIELLDAEGNNLVGKTLSFKDLDGTAAKDLLWEPGATYILPEVKIHNAGNLALKYHLTINGVVGDAKLLEAIEWTIKIGDTYISDTDGTILDGGIIKDNVLLPGETSGNITIQAHMKEEAGNEYQNLTLDGLGITVLATQVPYEQDSFGPTYDQNATYPTAPVVVSTLAELQYAIDNGQPAKLGANLKPADISKESTVIIKEGQVAVIDLNGYELGATGKINNQGFPVTGRTNYAIDNYGVLTIVGGGVEGEAIVARGVQNFGTMTVAEGVTIQTTDANGGAAIWNESKNGVVADLIINGAKLVATTDTTINELDGPACIINAGGNVEINGAECTSNSFAYAVINQSGNMVINDITVNSERGGIGCYGGTIVINKATVKAKGAQSSGHALYVSGGVVTINGGSFLLNGVEEAYAASPEMIIDNR